MPYQSHPVFKSNGLERTKLWRYIDFAKFVDMLRTNTLYFPSLGTLAKDDAKEGLYTDANKRAFERSYATLTRQELDYLKVEKAEDWETYRRAILGLINAAERGRQQYAVSCWHANDSETFAMWKIYSAERSGVCIQSTYSRLTKAFDKHVEDVVYIGNVNYVDYSVSQIEMGNSFSVSIAKRREFAYESEVRAVIHRASLINGADGQKYYDPVADTVGPGVRVRADADTLIEKIYVSPFAGDYLEDGVRDILLKYGISKEVCKSGI